MFTGVTFEQAMKYYQEGKKVLVLDKFSEPVNGRSYDLFPFAELFNNLQFLADVAAVENPEWTQAVAEMVGKAQEAEVSQSVTAGEKTCTDTPPEKASESSGGTEDTDPEPTKQQIVEELAMQGLSNKEIADRTGIKYSTVSVYAGAIRKKKGKQPVKEGWNKDKKACLKCQFRGVRTGCEYVLHRNQRRGCSVESCDKYIEGPRLSLREEVMVEEE